jgi:hypothetical protein
MGFQQSGVLDIENANASGLDESSVTDTSGTLTDRQKDRKRKAPSSLHPWLHEHYYVVVGYMGNQTAPRESLRRIPEIDGLFRQIRKAYRHLRNPLRRVMSLKEVCGFGVYECDPVKGYHKEVEVDKDTQRTLAELWKSYRSHKLDYGGRWLMWIHEHFNNGSKSPEQGRYTLEFKLRWSAVKVIIWGILPVLLSLAVGFWYMYSDHGDIDEVAVAEAAWVIATYIVTTSARKFLVTCFATQ